MSITIREKIVLFGIVTGIILVIISFIIMFIGMIIDFFTKSKGSIIIAGKIFNLYIFILQIGTIIFILSIAHRCLITTISGINTGQYNLAHNRYSSATTHTNWGNNPIRFIFQTIVYIGVYIGSIQYTWKIYTTFLKKEKIIKK